MRALRVVWLSMLLSGCALDLGEPVEDGDEPVGKPVEDGDEPVGKEPAEADDPWDDCDMPVDGEPLDEDCRHEFPFPQPRDPVPFPEPPVVDH